MIDFDAAPSRAAYRLIASRLRALLDHRKSLERAIHEARRRLAVAVTPAARSRARKRLAEASERLASLTR